MRDKPVESDSSIAADTFAFASLSSLSVNNCDPDANAAMMAIATTRWLLFSPGLGPIFLRVDTADSRKKRYENSERNAEPREHILKLILFCCRTVEF